MTIQEKKFEGKFEGRVAYIYELYASGSDSAMDNKVENKTLIKE